MRKKGGWYRGPGPTKKRVRISSTGALGGGRQGGGKGEPKIGRELRDKLGGRTYFGTPGNPELIVRYGKEGPLLPQVPSREEGKQQKKANYVGGEEKGVKGTNEGEERVNGELARSGTYGEEGD